MLFNELFLEFLAKDGYDMSKMELAYEVATQNNEPLYLEIIKEKIISEEECFQKVAQFLGLTFQVCHVTEIDLELVNEFPRDKLIELQCVPFSKTEEEIIFVGSNPFHFNEINELKYFGALKFKFHLIMQSQLKNILEFVENKAQKSEVLNDYSTEESESENNKKDDVKIDAPVIKLCDSILREAITRNTSDIHIEPFQDTFKIRYRIDSRLNVIDELPMSMFPALLARYKIMAELNIAERRVPQDGKINLVINDQKYDFRVSTLPTLYGEKIVIRIYNVSYTSTDLSRLGFNEHEQTLIKNMINRPHGIILLTGPTGSGKSTTLYSFLRNLNKSDTNIITVEDPVENEIPGVNQVQVNPKANLTFATALRSILRQDPNVIMIGEIRDEETAEIATRAAITGHLVLSSIHTNDAVGVISRLINMGIPKYLVADSLLASISQRLVRKLCPKCKVKYTTSQAEMSFLKLDEPKEIYKATGCSYCNFKGYYGRIGVFEIMVLDEKIREFIMDENFTSDKVSRYLEGRMTSLLENVKQRVLQGETTMDEYEQLSDVIKVKS